MLPGKNGFDVARTLRAESDFVPILMLTARARPEDVLVGFESGADDYLPKPFELAILLARVRGLLRRRQWLRGPVQTSRPRPCRRRRRPTCSSSPATGSTCARSNCTPTAAPTG